MIPCYSRYARYVLHSRVGYITRDSRGYCYGSSIGISILPPSFNAIIVI